MGTIGLCCPAVPSTRVSCHRMGRCRYFRATVTRGESGEAVQYEHVLTRLRPLRHIESQHSVRAITGVDVDRGRC